MSIVKTGWARFACSSYSIDKPIATRVLSQRVFGGDSELGQSF